MRAYSRFMTEATQFAKGLPPRSPAVALGHHDLGLVGMLEPGRPPHLQKISERTLERYLRADELGAITTWDGVLANRAAGYIQTLHGFKNRTTVKASASQWICSAQLTGHPVAASYTDIPGGAVMNSASVGAIPLALATGGRTKYLTGCGGQFGVMDRSTAILVDILVAAGNIPTSVTTATTINTTALTRYTDGVGVFAALDTEVKPANVNAGMILTYTGADNGAGQVTAAGTICPLSEVGGISPYSASYQNWAFSMAAGDRGIVSVESAQMNTTGMSDGIMALLLFKPLVFFPSTGSTGAAYGAAVSDSPGTMMSRIIELPVGSDDALGFLAFFVTDYTSTSHINDWQLYTMEG